MNLYPWRPALRRIRIQPPAMRPSAPPPRGAFARCQPALTSRARLSALPHAALHPPPLGLWIEPTSIRDGCADCRTCTWWPITIRCRPRVSQSGPGSAGQGQGQRRRARVSGAGSGLSQSGSGSGNLVVLVERGLRMGPSMGCTPGSAQNTREASLSGRKCANIIFC